jgi:predicted GNAT family acetyltransferase
MKNELQLVLSAENDCDELGELNKAFIDDGGSINNMHIEELKSRMHWFIQNGFVALIFEVDGHHVGYALIDTNQTPIFIRHFFVKKSFRRRGYGTSAFVKIVEHFNANAINLTVLCSNEIGNKFWAKCGLVAYETVMYFRKCFKQKKSEINGA